jgi:acyl-CoA synthetase (AMP-forming)/AMP-acid ligase II
MIRAGVEPSGIERVSDFVTWYAARTPESEALVIDDLRIDYGELAIRVEALAKALLAAGVAKGDRVVTLATPHPDYFMLFLATSAIGAIWVGLNPKYRREELRYVVADCEPVVMFTRTRVGDRDYGEDIEEMRRAVPSLRRVVALDEVRADMPVADIGSLRDFLQGADNLDAAALAAAQAECGGRDPCLIVYTSGSTGRPKGAVLHHEGIVRCCLAQNRLWPVPQQRVLNFLPVNHVGCVVDLSCPTLAAGGCLVFMEHFDVGESLRLMQRERISWWASVPSVFQMQLAHPDFAGCDLSAVELIVWEGAAMPQPMIERLAAICPRLATNYGMTETTSAMTAEAPTTDLDILADSVGLPFDDVEIRLVKEDGTVAAPGEPGEVQARSAYNMLGYWRRPQETAATLLPDGWLRTGDVAVCRPDGRLQLIGRLKEMFKSGGYNVYPREVEAVLEEHDAVDTAVVVGVPDTLWGEVGVAYVLARAPVSADTLLGHCRQRLANYKVPKRLYVVDALPLLPIGKVDKVALRQRAQTMTGQQGDQPR